MAVSRAMRRLLRLLEIQEEQYRAALASALAVAAGTRLAELGLGVPVAKEPSVPVKELAVHSIVCVAAEASETTPQATRAGLLAALERAEKLGVTSEELTEALRKGEGAGG